MTKHLLLLLFSFKVGLILGQSKVIESLSMDSELLKTSVKYSVYLPDGFENSNTSYPIVYLLNGFTGDETDWNRLGHVKDITDELIKGNKIDQMVIVMPDGDDRLYMNKDDGSYPFEDMFIKELMPFVESKYRIKKEKKFRGISGLSMGGAGSLRLALKYHDLFGACAAFSAGISTVEELISEGQKSFDSYFGLISPSVIGAKGEERLNETIKDYNIFNMVKSKNIEHLKSVNIYFDCGDDDFLAVGNATLHIELKNRGIPHEYRVRDGAHTWNFWINSLPIGLEFISDTMRN
ncbi:alpha/beta hydrolase [Winogradskyella alexanderae]|uniref:Esterase family protein n=1 Tax=Winogradskyella alexanderae TaxID=2877123 RepID=A0ABS7XVP0_9FLAO|nr:alpha/beta hydrolase-fold protein [Winogradskyella alexanderae]MCA0132896.1 esterase family protein [Winogradskyella alexanderae]